MRVGFCVSGNGSLFRAAVANRDKLSIEPWLLVTESKANADLEAFSSRNGVRCIRLDPADRPAFDRELTRVLVEAELDLIALTFDRVLPPELVRHYAGRLINVHPALLPAFQGMRGMERTLASGVRFGGATLHDVVDEVDAGAIIAQAVVATVPDEPLADYGRRVYELLEPMFLQVISWYAEGRVVRDGSGRIGIRGARYGTLPISPALERFGSRE
ncbi:MAG TPA: formyltransferase family protein [Thermoanaerobaculia bacterium]|nr:formyltransferase family protein [Thermoanaerobaculia bacterium]